MGVITGAIIGKKLFFVLSFGLHASNFDFLGVFCSDILKVYQFICDLCAGLVKLNHYISLHVLDSFWSLTFALQIQVAGESYELIVLLSCIIQGLYNCIRQLGDSRNRLICQAAVDYEPAKAFARSIIRQFQDSSGDDSATVKHSKNESPLHLSNLQEHGLYWEPITSLKENVQSIEFFLTMAAPVKCDLNVHWVYSLFMALIDHIHQLANCLIHLFRCWVCYDHQVIWLYAQQSHVLLSLFHVVLNIRQI